MRRIFTRDEKEGLQSFLDTRERVGKMPPLGLTVTSFVNQEPGPARISRLANKTKLYCS